MRAGRGRESLLQGPGVVWSPTGEPGGVGRTFWRASMVERVKRGRRPSRRARRGREALLKGQEALGGPPGGPLGVRSPFLVGREGSEGHSYGMVGAGRGQEALPERPRVGWEALPEGREGLRGPSGEPGGFDRAKRGRKALLVGPGGDRRTSRAAKACPIQRMHKLITSGAFGDTSG